MVKFRARFTGICAYIPDVEFQDPNKDPKEVIILMPEARLSKAGVGRTSSDGIAIRPHAPLIDFDPRSLVSGGSGISEGVRVSYFLDRRKISFKIEEEHKAVKGVNDFRVIQGPKATRARGGKKDFNWGVHIRDIFDGSNNFKLRKNILEDKKSRRIISAKVMLNTYGEVSSFGLDMKTIFNMSATKSGGFDPRPLSEQVALEFSDVRSVTLVAEDLDQRRKPIEFKFDTSKVKSEKDIVDILIGNFCCDNIMPRSSRGSAACQQSDEDFRWYYGLFDPKAIAKIKSDLSGLCFPVPFPLKIKAGGGLKPVQCMRLNLHAHK